MDSILYKRKENCKVSNTPVKSCSLFQNSELITLELSTFIGRASIYLFCGCCLLQGFLCSEELLCDFIWEDICDGIMELTNHNIPHTVGLAFQLGVV